MFWCPNLGHANSWPASTFSSSWCHRQSIEATHLHWYYTFWAFLRHGVQHDGRANSWGVNNTRAGREVQVKRVFLCTSWRRMGERTYRSAHSLTVALDSVQWSDSRITPGYPLNWCPVEPQNRRFREGKPFVPVQETRALSSIVQPGCSLVAVPTELFRLHLNDCPLGGNVSWHRWCFTSIPPIRLHGVVLKLLISDHTDLMFFVCWREGRLIVFFFPTEAAVLCLSAC